MIKVLFLTAELAPFTKVGGLGDVAAALPPALRKLSSDIDVRVFTPLHGRARAKMKSTPVRVAHTSVSHPAGPITADAWRTEVDGTPVFFVSSPVLDEDGPVYHADSGWDAHRFVTFSLASLALARETGFVPDVLHCHDWHTAAAIAAVHRDRFIEPEKGRVHTVLTIHNLPYLGYGAEEAMRAFGLVPAYVPNVPSSLSNLPLPIALSLVDRITTVSPGYAGEILSPAFSAGLDPLLRARSKVLTGILNGLDTEAWNPATDRALTKRFEPAAVDSREANKVALQKELGFPWSDAPMFGVVSRLSQQKGIDILPEAISLLPPDVSFQLVVLGTGDRTVEEALLRTASEFAPRVAVRLAFDEALSRRIYAGADFLLIPSRYEPCGLTQMIAMRYGCVPVARETGGLRDTVRDLDLHDDATGFLFPVATAQSLAFAMRRAVATYGQPWRMQVLQKNGMEEDFSWARAASMYASVYRQLIDSEHVR